MNPKEGAPNDVGSDGRDAERGKIPNVELSHDHLKGEEHTGERSVKGGRNAPGRSGGDQVLDARLRHLEQLTQAGAQCRADLDNGPFTTDGTTGSDGQGRGNRLDHDDGGTHAPSLYRNRQHHLRHTMPACFRSEVANERAEDERA